MVSLEQISVWTIISVFGAGVLISLTPCIYPVIPGMIAYFGGTATGSRGAAFVRAVCYVTGMAVVYAVIGAVVALSGGIFGVFQNNVWVKVFVANIFIIMGLSMLDVFSLPQISFVRAAGPRGRGLAGAFVMGATTGLVLGPCTTPVMASLLAYVAARRSVAAGMLLLFAYAVGMGLPLLVLGSGIGMLQRLPKIGAWQLRIKKFFGFALIAAAQYVLVFSG